MTALAINKNPILVAEWDFVQLLKFFDSGNLTGTSENRREARLNN